ncbi:putative uncharacterized protein [Prevotella sp. CAG:891]|jgi:hypothetical protein|nr:hypothetical protein [Prevotellamassilia sp.]CDE85966.1 putative uncharacterized protein [Prevotella sp. CAG:891]
MQTKLYLSLALAGSLALTSCKKLGELSADNFTVTPSPMEAVSGKVPVTINGRFPEKYMKKKAVVTVTPEIRYEGGKATGQSATFQGEKVQGNDQEISYKLGGNYTMKNSFDYVPEMQKSELYLTFQARVGKKEVEVPAVKVADGVLATSTLIKETAGQGTPADAADAYQYAIKQTKQAQIKYLINQANVRTSELKSTSVQEFVKTLRDIKADQKGFMLENIEVSAYASPDGDLDFNTKLAEKRQNTSSNYVSKQLKANELNTKVDEKYTAEDWDGFKELLQASNIQDKDVILRVLSMYEDPEEREKQIRNLSAGYKELADEILPELRRARLTINYNLIGRTDDEIKQQYKADAKELSVEELLYAATLTNDANEKKDIYTTTTKQYPEDYRAYNNLASLAYQDGDLAAAKNYLAQAAAKKGDAAEVNANRAFVAMAEGNYDEAQNYLSKATAAKNYNELLGNLQVAQGNYAQAAQSLQGVKTNSAALAQILNKDYTAAASTLSQVAKPNATTSYLKAIVSARTGQNAAVISNLKDAIAKDANLKARAAKDLEFVALFNDANFQSLVK